MAKKKDKAVEDVKKVEEVKAEEAAPKVEEPKKEERLESTHDKMEKAEKVAPAVSGETERKAGLPKLNEELFMVGDEIELEGCKFKVHELSGLKLTLKRADIK